LLELVESGSLANLETKWWKDQGECPEDPVVDSCKVKLINVHIQFPGVINFIRVLIIAQELCVAYYLVLSHYAFAIKIISSLYNITF
jgi:hypothetical protein